MSVVVVDRVSFAYAGNRRALHEVSLAADAGITGIIGPNAAGKSTLLRLIAGLEPPTEGTIIIGGEPSDSARSAGRIGMVPETSHFDEYLRVGEFLDAVAALSHLGLGAVPPGVNELYDRRLDTLSLGQRRRVEIVAALIGTPAVLLLDEPTNGLDPFAVSELRETVTALRAAGAVILISSHHLDELQRIADHLVLIRDGRCLGSWTRAAVLQDFGSVEALFRSVLEHQPPVQPC